MRSRKSHPTSLDLAVHLSCKDPPGSGLDMLPSVPIVLAEILTLSFTCAG